MKDGDCKPIFETSPNVVSSEVKIGSQEHFYMEAQSCIAIPKGEDGEMELISSTQNPTGVQVRKKYHRLSPQYNLSTNLNFIDASCTMLKCACK